MGPMPNSLIAFQCIRTHHWPLGLVFNPSTDIPHNFFSFPFLATTTPTPHSHYPLPFIAPPSPLSPTTPTLSRFNFITPPPLPTLTTPHLSLTIHPLSPTTHPLLPISPFIPPLSSSTHHISLPPTSPPIYHLILSPTLLFSPSPFLPSLSFSPNWLCPTFSHSPLLNTPPGSIDADLQNPFEPTVAVVGAKKLGRL